MALNTSLKSSMLGVAMLGALCTSAIVSAQCTINPTPDFTQNDGGCPIAGAVDPNGGCNESPAVWQTTRTLTGTDTMTIGGSCGADSVLGRDLDWYKFSVSEPCFVEFTLNMANLATNPPTASTNMLVFFSDNPAACTAGGWLRTVCPAVFPEQFIATPGEYGVIVTTDFLASGGMPCNYSYTLTVTTRVTAYAQCGNPASGTCGVATPGIGGCQDIQCCDRICVANPLCCDIEWDASCGAQAQQPESLGGCGVFVYDCPPASSAPANNCATAAETIGLNAIANFDNTFATTDGPNNGQCGSDTAKDVWFAVQVPAAGNLVCTVNSPTQDVVVSAYNYGTGGAPFDPTQLANNFAGCVDVAGIGGESGRLENVAANTWVLWRVGIWGNPTTPGTEGVAGAGTVEFTLERPIWDTGRHEAVCFQNAATNLGLSSGAINDTQPQRWLAVPFTVSDPVGAEDVWRASQFVPEGFQPAGTTNTSMNWILWRRTGSTVPNYALDQLASGQVAAPALGTNGEARLGVDLVLTPGDYYLTCFASALGNPCRVDDAQGVFSNFAWFIGAPSGIGFSDATGPYYWRSAVQPGSGPADEVVIAGSTAACEGGPAAGFVRYTAPATALPCGGAADSSLVYRAAFQVLGAPEASNNCPADLNGDGAVNSADLSILLGGWGATSPDLNGDGVVGSADLSVLLSSWGACQ